MIYVGIDIASEKHDFFMIQAETGITFSKSLNPQNKPSKKPTQRA